MVPTGIAVRSATGRIVTVKGQSSMQCAALPAVAAGHSSRSALRSQANLRGSCVMDPPSPTRIA